jgi:hypothetical protein
MLAEPNRTPITVYGCVPHIENGHEYDLALSLGCGVSVQSAAKIERIDRDHLDG